MDKYIGEKGTLVASIVHHNPEEIEAYVEEIRRRTGIIAIDWFYIVGIVAIIKAIGDLNHIGTIARLILPPQCTLHLSVAA